MKHSLIALAIASGIAAIAACGAAAADTVRMMPSVRIAPGRAITLGEVAKLEGKRVEAFASVEVARGEEGAFELSAERVRQILVVQGADMRSIEIEGNRTVVRPLRGVVDAPAAPAGNGVRVIDPTTETGKGTALSTICEMVINAYGDDATGLRLECSDEQLARIAPRTGVRHEIVRKSSLRSPRIELEVAVLGGQSDGERIRIRLDAKFDRSVAVATADVRRGMRAPDADAADSAIRIERRLLTPNEARDAADPSALAGATFTRGVGRGAIVMRGDFARTAEIRRRETVMVRREIDSVVLEFEAIALEDGAAGQSISFVHSSRKGARDAKPFKAEVVARGRAVMR